MLGDETIAVLGLGLIGGSLARDLSACGARVLGYDHDPATVHAALDARAIASAVGDALSGLREASIVVLAVPVDAAAALLERAAPFLGQTALVTDVGSTKLVIGAQAAKLGMRARFVGAHPMAGDHRSGFAASRVGLFDDACVYLTPSAQATPVARAKSLALWHTVGATVRWTTAELHDAEVAFTSHLPHLLAAALARTIASAGLRPDALGPAGREMTRLARSSPAMWRAIVATNHDAIVAALGACAAEFDTLRAMVERRDLDGVARSFAEAGAWSEPSNHRTTGRKKARGAAG